MLKAFRLILTSCNHQMMDLKLNLLLLLLFLTQGCDCMVSDGCGAALENLQPGLHYRFNVDVPDPYNGDVSRFYVLHIPAQFDLNNEFPLPLLIDFPGWTVTAEQQMNETPWNQV